MFVITSLPSSISAEKVLKFYRLRWQVELVFKRYKSLLGLGNIPTKTKESSEVWLNGKMFLALLIEKYLGDIDLSPSPRLSENPIFILHFYHHLLSNSIFFRTKKQRAFFHSVS